MKKPENDLVFVPLGGVGEIGMNLAMYGYGNPAKRKWIVVDVGVTFPGPTLPGVDLILPDIRFLESKIDDLEAIIITHAHEDHYGALLTLWPRLRAPVYCTPFTAGMLEAKRYSERNAPDIPLTIFKAGEKFPVGQFEIEALNVTHSIPEPVSLAIKTPLGRIIHTGDWKMDTAPSLGEKTDEKHFRRLGKDGVLALICDSTNAMREGVSPSEQEVSDSLANVIEESEGRVLITTFSSNVGRIRSIALAAEKAGRKVMIFGRSMLRVCDVSRELGYLDGIAPFVNDDEYASIPRNKLVVILTGSQGEPRAALAKLAKDEHHKATLAAGDRVVYSSRIIPGNGKSIIEIQNALIEQGVEIITDNDALVHVSGHPRRNELRAMYDWVKPTIAVPVHGEAAHLSAHAKLAGEIGIEDVAPVRNGDMLRLAPGPAEIIDQVPHGRFYKDGKMLGSEKEIGVGERRGLSYAGHVSMSLIINKHGDLIADPDIEIIGLPEMADAEDTMEDCLYDAAVGALEGFPRGKRKNVAKVKEAVRRAVRAEARQIWGKKPVTTIFVARV